MEVDEGRRSKLVEVFANVITQICRRNDHNRTKKTSLTRFDALQPPQITLEYYVKRIAKYSGCSVECFILALIYLDRLIVKNPGFLVTSHNAHRLVITSIMVAAKFFDDHYFNNTYYGHIGGVSRGEMNVLEVEFLFMVNYNLFVNTEMHQTYSKRLMTHYNSQLKKRASYTISRPINIPKKQISRQPAANKKTLPLLNGNQISPSHQMFTKAMVTQQFARQFYPLQATKRIEVLNKNPRKAVPFV